MQARVQEILPCRTHWKVLRRGPFLILQVEIVVVSTSVLSVEMSDGIRICQRTALVVSIGYRDFFTQIN